MVPRWLFVVAVLGGCGRFGFGPTEDAIKDAQTGENGDSGPRPETRLIPILGTNGVHDALFDPAGNLVVVGTFATSVSVGGMTMSNAGATQDMFLAELDPQGAATRLWTGGSTSFGSGQNLSLLSDGSLAVSGYFAGTLTNGMNLMAGSRQAALVAAFDPAGSLSLARHYQAGSNVQARGVATAPNRIALVGIYAGSVDFGAGALPAAAFDNGFVATMDLAGTNVVSRAFNAGNDVFVNDVVFEPSGDLCIGGRFNGTTNFGLGAVAPQGGGSTGFVARYDAALVPRWVRTFGTSTTVTNVEVLANGDCIAVGDVGGTIMIDGITITATGPRDGWVARFAGTDGTVAWIKTLAGADSELIQYVAVYSDLIAIAGQFTTTAQLAGAQMLTSDGSKDVVVAGLELDGTLAWSTQLGGTGDSDLGLGGMAVDAAGQLVAVTLSYSGELVVDGQTFTGGTADGAVILVAIPP